ncbi:hypothetical protein LSI99_12735, partial [Klebsiella quasipneumoniae subsp. similipneumoniae]|nr:hypothetical protein [Klebsiella quasipneumoniae subsp. similipneumoniae]
TTWTKTLPTTKSTKRFRTKWRPGMTERGMIFNGEMVRALLSGRKTQTRRIVKGTDGAVKFCKEWDINGKEVFVVLGEKTTQE